MTSNADAAPKQSTYRFQIGSHVSSGTVPSTAGTFSTGMSEIAGDVTTAGRDIFTGPGSTATGYLTTYGSDMTTNDFGTVTLTDAASGLVEFSATSVADLNVLGSSKNNADISCKGTEFSQVSNFGTAVYSVVGGNQDITFDNVGTAEVEGAVGNKLGLVENVGEDTQAALLDVGNLKSASIVLSSISDTSPDAVSANAVGTLSVSGQGGGLSLTARTVYSVSVSEESSLSYTDLAPMADLSLTNADDSALSEGAFKLLGGNEKVTIDQGYGQVDLTNALTFDLTGSVATGVGDTITVNDGMVTGSPSADSHNVVFLLGAGKANLTVNGSQFGIGPFKGTEVIGGSGAAVIHGGPDGTDVTFGTGKTTVWGGAGHNAYSFGAYGSALHTLDFIEDFKVGTDVLSLSSSVERQTKIENGTSGTLIVFGTHEVDLVGIHGFTAQDIHWT